MYIFTYNSKATLSHRKNVFFRKLPGRFACGDKIFCVWQELVVVVVVFTVVLHNYFTRISFRNVAAVAVAAAGNRRQTKHVDEMIR